MQNSQCTWGFNLLLRNGTALLNLWSRSIPVKFQSTRSVVIAIHCEWARQWMQHTARLSTIKNGTERVLLRVSYEDMKSRGKVCEE
jgi:hypothetical protein